MKILMVVQNFQVGGITTACLNMLQELSGRTGYEIDLFSFGSGPYMDQLPAGIRLLRGSRRLELVSTPMKLVLRSGRPVDMIRRIGLMVMVRAVGSERFYRWLLEREGRLCGYDIAISYFDDMTTSYFNQGTLLYVKDHTEARRKICWSHTDPVGSGFDREHYRAFYRGFDCHVSVSHAMKRRWQEFLPEYAASMKVVHNFMDGRKLKEKAAEMSVQKESGKLNLVTVARIDNGSKRLDRICTVSRMLVDAGYRDFIWTVVGDGPDFKQMQEEIAQNHLEEHVRLLGFKENPYPYVAGQDLFVLTSDYEGLPVVVREAQILGVPVLSTDYDAAVELIEEGKSGWIVKRDADALFGKIRYFLTDGRQELRRVADALSLESYGNQVPMKEFEEAVRDGYEGLEATI